MFLNVNILLEEKRTKLNHIITRAEALQYLSCTVVIAVLAAVGSYLHYAVGYWKYQASQWVLNATGFLRMQRSDSGGKRPGRQ